MTNIGASLVEDVLVAIVVVLALSYPDVALAVAALLLFVGITLLLRAWKRIRRFREVLRARRA